MTTDSEMFAAQDDLAEYAVTHSEELDELDRLDRVAREAEAA